MGILSNGGKETLIQATQHGIDDDGDQSITKKDLDRFRKQVQSDKNRGETKENLLQAGRKGFNSLRKGVHDVAVSLNTPDSKKRPRIARIPNLRKADLSTTINLDKMKHPDLLKRDIRGKRVKPE